MQTYLECVPCFVRQALGAGVMVTDDPAVHERLLRETLRLVAEMPFDRPPPWMGQRIHRLLRKLTGNPDPYRQAKIRSNALALELYPTLRRQVYAGCDPFAASVRIAIAGNVIDFAQGNGPDDIKLRRVLEEAITASHTGSAALAIDELRQAIKQADSILFLADNAGELVLDRLLLEQMPRDRVTVAVRGSPVINDATLRDAEVADLMSLVNVMDNGSDAPGTILQSCSVAFKERFARSDLVIAKGQGNYETLNEENARIVFLLRAKCPVIARDIGCAVDEPVICQNHREQNQTRASSFPSELET